MTRTYDGYDVVVVGHGIAGLSTAISAREAGAEVAILEKSPREERGGHSRFAGATMRFPMEDPPEVEERLDLETAPGRYTAEEFRNDILRITNGRSNEELLDVLVGEGYEAIQWLHDHGVEFQVHHDVGDRPETNPIKQSKRGERLQAVGEGEAVVETLGDRAEELGVDLHFETEVRDFLVDDYRVRGVIAKTPDGEARYEAPAVALCAGSYVSDTEKLTRYFGKHADEFVIRGSSHNTGEALEAALDAGAQSSGQWGGAHQVLLDANAPPVEGGRTRINGYQYGVILNKEGERFVDEGEDVLAKTYAKFGRKAYEEPGQCAFVVYDSKVAEYVNSQMNSDPIVDDSLEDLLAGIDLRGLSVDDVPRALRTIDEFNDACQPGEFDPTQLDGVHTEGISPPKTNWAQPIDEPPYYCYPVKPGMTFAFGGVKIDTESRAIDTQGNPIPGLWAVGNSTSEIFYYNYAAGSAQTRGAVFGRIAGEGAARYARSAAPEADD